jgi:mannosyltransferase OCH1-like enzyme
MNIPKNMFHIWVGPHPAPMQWMRTWPELHPDWNYTIVDNDYLATHKFRNCVQIDSYMRREMYAGAADLIRYELIYQHGGFVPPADAVCLANTDELWSEPEHICYTVYENEALRPGYVSPIYAANAGNEFLELIIDTLHRLKPTDCISPWRTTGNAFLARLIEEHQPEIKIFPSYYFIPKHSLDTHVRYSGLGKVYADQKWGTTKHIYDRGV